ncbi:MAG: carbohydrate kinase family protein [Ruminococcaceae bacterium]|nr:carbohydrate kinase family protein [Oscillospiraceae bacterium]
MAVVYGFGSAAVDFRIRTADYGDLYKDKLLAQSWAEMGGGAVANFLAQVSRLGVKTAFVGKLGKDVIGNKIIELMEKENIDCSGVIISETECSPFNVAVYSGPEMRRRGGFLIPNSLAKLTAEDIEKLASPVCAEDFVMIEIGEVPPAQVIAFANAVHAKGAKLCIDVDLDPVRQCGFTPEEFDGVCRLCDYLIPNVVSMATIYPNMTAESLSEKMFAVYGKPCIVSAGKDGAYYTVDETGAKNVSIYEAEVVDTVGAGDAFHGGVVYGLVTGMSVERAVRCGTVCGGINCSTFGARDGMARGETVRKIMEEY